MARKKKLSEKLEESRKEDNNKENKQSHLHKIINEINKCCFI